MDPFLQLWRIGMTSGLAIGTVGRAASEVASGATMVTGLLWAYDPGSPVAYG